MLSLFSCIVLSAWAQTLSNKYGVTNPPLTASAEKQTENSIGAYASGIFGNGRAYGGNTTGDRSMNWKAMSFRFGKEFNPSIFGVAPILSDREKTRVDFVYYNEGHPDNNHRDGFGMQLVYSNALHNDVTAEFGVGPYLSMNTTEIGGVQINNSNLGAILSLALRIDLDPFSQGIHMRIALNHVAMRDVHSSNALLVGIGKYFREVPAYPTPAFPRNPVWVSLAAGSSNTNQSGTDDAALFSLETKQHWGPWAASIAAIVEGDDGFRVDRRGIAVQGWFVQPLTEKWTVSAGVGPYVAVNDRDAGHPRLLGLFTLQVDRSISKTMKFFVSFSRVRTFMEKHDRDLSRIGVMKQFGE